MNAIDAKLENLISKLDSSATNDIEHNTLTLVLVLRKYLNVFLDLVQKVFLIYDLIFYRYIHKKIGSLLNSNEFLILIIYVIFVLTHIPDLELTKSFTKQTKTKTLTDTVFGEQNLLRTRISCSDTVTLDERDKQFSRLKSEKYRLFDQFYIFNNIKNSTNNDNINIYNMKYELFTKSNDSKQLVEFLNKLKFCTLKSYSRNFDSKSIYSDRKFNFKSLLKNSKNIKKSKFKFLNPDSVNLKSGGYYKPPLCFQEYLYYHTSYDNLLVLKSIMDDYRTTKDFSLENLIEKLSEFTYGIIRDNFNSIAQRNSISKFVKSKEQDLSVIIIPMLNRESNLLDLMFNLHPFLQRQFLHYKILVVEQDNSRDAFNKGRLYNAAFFYLLKNYKIFGVNDQIYNGTKELNLNCLILHDVDLIPESDYNIYGCGDSFVGYYNDEMPRHLSLSIRSENEKKGNTNYSRNLYELLVGGVLSIRPDKYEKINGFSNEYWNWGAEDDDLAFRMIACATCITRPRDEHALFKMSKHRPSSQNINRENILLGSLRRHKVDGISNFEKLNLLFVDEEHKSLFTHIRVIVGRQSDDY
ncbi:unnamed protein product [Brachionus calyciflorus]|uniref:Uncharacterized protein n=1 Tax=Brachionus calyciflorus TaxID=104777 RepID=A0A813X539_9BILA|nr:unnamed protein product [Brachionus calyciflorus]